MLANIALAVGVFATGLTGWLPVTWSVLLGAYGTASLCVAFAAARRHGWDLLPLLPLVFATYHFAYGLGFLAGIVYWSLTPAGKTKPGHAFTAITR